MVHIFIAYNFTYIITIYRQAEFSSYQADVVVQNYKKIYKSEKFAYV
jgi:hypothetical protein